MKTSTNHLKRVIIKVGTATLTDAYGNVDRDYLRNLVGQALRLIMNGIQCIIVSSGAIRAGIEQLKLQERLHTIPEKQAAAAVGQGLLLQLYSGLFAEAGITTAQVLLTRNDFVDRARYLNARNTLNSLLSFGCVPIVNENDTIAVDEIKFGDNDTLAALVAAAVGADMLILLADVPGLYDRDPSLPGCRIIPEVRVITPEIKAIAGGPAVDPDSGAMRSRVDAAEIATSSGIETIIIDGRQPDCLSAVIRGESVGTRFLAGGSKLSHRKRWVAYSSPIKGSIVVNEGARKMVVDAGKSLLPAGITNVIGNFQAGDLVAITDEKGNRIARGFANYSAIEIRQIMGVKTSEIEGILGYKDFDEVIHRDNLVLGV